MFFTATPLPFVIPVFTDNPIVSPPIVSPTVSSCPIMPSPITRYPVEPSNQLLVSVLNQLYSLRVSQGKQWSARSYQKAAEIIGHYPEVITSGKQAKSIKGIGVKIADCIDQIIKTGTVTELAELAETEPPKIFSMVDPISLPVSSLPLVTIDVARHQVVEEFSKIDRVGPVTAGKWYDAGYRNLNDLIAAGQEKLKCTPAQWIGITFYPEVSQRIPRSEIEMISHVLRHHLDAVNPALRFDIAGSYRRGRPNSGDIDILVLLPGNSTIEDPKPMQDVLSCPLFTHTLARGEKKYLGIGRLSSTSVHRRIDVEIVSAQQYPFALSYFTGSANFNVQLRSRAEDHGYRLNEKGIFNAVTLEPATDPATNLPVVINHENELLAFLHLPYFEPTEREHVDLSTYPW
jgi:DNA polymerase IV